MGAPRVRWKLAFWTALVVIAVIILALCGLALYDRAATAPVAAAPSTLSITSASGTVINLLTPLADSVWTIGGANSITWDTAAGVTAEIDLVNAVTKAPIGVIVSQIDSNQTSYSWDARSISLARFSADTKTVAPGTYAIRIRFDGNGFGNLVSDPVTITK